MAQESSRPRIGEGRIGSSLCAAIGVLSVAAVLCLRYPAFLTTPELRALWEQELAHMRERIREMRRQLVDKLRASAPKADFGFVLRQRGMFSYSGLSREQVVRLREEFSVYAIESGRICVAALNRGNIDYAADCIARVIA